MWITIVVILFFGCLLFMIRNYYVSNKKILEKFEEIQKQTMTKYDRFVEIIKGFEIKKGTKPSPNELHAYYDYTISKDKFNRDDIAMLLSEQSYKKIIGKFMKENDQPEDIIPDKTPKIQTEISNNINDELDDEETGKLVMKSYEKIYPGEVISPENKDFLIYKFKKVGNDVKALEDYMTDDEEYNTFIKKRMSVEFKTHHANDDKEDKVFEIKRPDVNSKTLIEKKTDTAEKRTCKDLEDEQVLSKLMSERNLQQLKYSCMRSKEKYANLDEKMVLLPDQKWSVPQIQPEVCRMSGEMNYQPSTEQTALIGTLLNVADDTQVGSIMPEFKYEENDE